MAGTAGHTLPETLDQLRKRIAHLRERGERISEQDTKAGLIEPVLSALGWGFDDVRREYRRKPQDNPVDYALLTYRTPRLFVEAKALDTPLDQKGAAQVLGYAAVVGVTWCLLTDGDEYRLYNAHAAVPVEEKLFRSVQVSDTKDEARCLETLELIAKEHLEASSTDLEWLWKCQFVDRRVKMALTTLFEENDPKLVNLVRRNLPDLSPSEIRDSLGRATMRLHYPSASKRSEAQPATSTTGPRRKGKAPSEAGVNKGELGRLIAAGLITPPLRLEGRYKGVDLEATIEVDGRIRFGERYFRTPSGAGSAAKRAAAGPADGPPITTSGWTFWRYRDASGKLHPLNELRRQAESRREAIG